MKQKYTYGSGRHKVVFNSVEEICEACIDAGVLGSIFCDVIDYYIDKNGIEIIEKNMTTIINISTYYLYKTLGSELLKNFRIVKR